MKTKRAKITPEMALRLKELWEQGVPSRDIQNELGLRAAAISQHVRRNAIARPHTVSSRTNLVIKDGLYQCTWCKDFKSAAEYQVNKCGYLIGICRDCRTKNEREKIVSDPDVWIRTRLNSYKHRATKDKIAYNLDVEYVKELYKKQDGKCFYSDYPLNWGHNSNVSKWESFSVDKVIPDRGYVKGNVVLAQTRINSAKSDFSLDEMKLWMPEWYNRIVLCEWIEK